MTHGDPQFDKSLAEYLRDKKVSVEFYPWTLMRYGNFDGSMSSDFDTEHQARREFDKRPTAYLPAASLDIGYQMRVIEALGYGWTKGLSYEKHISIWSTYSGSLPFPSILDALRYIIKEEK